MDTQITKSLRLPRTLVRQIEQFAKAEGSTFSQVLRTAAIKTVNERKASKLHVVNS